MRSKANGIGPISKIRAAGGAALLAAAVVLTGAAGCDDDEEEVAGTDIDTEDAYLYDSYYPADVAYSSAYWADDWAYDDLYLSVWTPAAQSASTDRAFVGNAIRALARGESVCPNQVTVTPKTTTPACTVTTDTTRMSRNGATIVFNGCQLSGGGTVSGTVDVSVTRSASEPICSATTTISLTSTTTVTNLDYTGPGGGRLLIPSATDTGSASFTFGQNPASLSINSNGQLQIFRSGGNLLADHNYNGMRTFKFAGSRSSYSVDGTLNIQDNRASGSATITTTGLTRTTGCCRPTAGTVDINRTGGTFPGQHTFTFGPSCGQATFDGNTATLPACI